MGSSTRETILRSLRAREQCTVKELAELVGISPVSVRHHITHLQADGLVVAREVRHGVGRPHHVFSLTEQALELFPTHYLRLTNRLLEEIKESISQEKVEELLSSIADSIIEDHAERFKDLPLEGRLVRLIDLLAEEGFEAEYEVRGDQFILRAMSCPYIRIAREHPEVCLMDQSFVARALSLPVARVTCLAEGDPHCVFAVSSTDGEG